MGTPSMNLGIDTGVSTRPEGIRRDEEIQPIFLASKEDFSDFSMMSEGKKLGLIEPRLKDLGVVNDFFNLPFFILFG